MGKAFNRLTLERRAFGRPYTNWRSYTAAQTSLLLQLLAYIEPRIESDALGEQLVEEIRNFRSAAKEFHNGQK